jgi:hypothetical protein
MYVIAPQVEISQPAEAARIMSAQIAGPDIVLNIHVGSLDAGCPQRLRLSRKEARKWRAALGAALNSAAAP